MITVSNVVVYFTITDEKHTNIRPIIKQVKNHQKISGGGFVDVCKLIYTLFLKHKGISSLSLFSQNKEISWFYNKKNTSHVLFHGVKNEKHCFFLFQGPLFWVTSLTFSPWNWEWWCIPTQSWHWHYQNDDIHALVPTRLVGCFWTLNCRPYKIES